MGKLNFDWEEKSIYKCQYCGYNDKQDREACIKMMEEIAKKQHRPSHVKEWEFVAPKF